ncbi:vacuolar protein sorting-associated protein 16 homolog [Ischnura elegans]|uniref:vacuolar protein sorting-associated protein 16 homolog n=1 Tax=Ischnura elegans TaxID=197161 RepID=UPI001ED86E69|nr:vacuolar protein sorting-associated protein 16 homolog [Ischnura elegans]
MSAMLTADWCCGGKDVYFRKFEIYNMGWLADASLDGRMVAAAPFGGPIALTRDRRQIVKVHGVGKPKVAIYSASGVLLGGFVWSGGQLLQMGWTTEEELLCVQDDGQVLIYDIFGKHRHTFGIGQEAKEFKVIEAKIFNHGNNGTGIVVMTSLYRIYLINNIKDPRAKRLAEAPNVNTLPNCWINISEDRQTRVLLAYGKQLYVLMHGQNAQPVKTELDEEIVDIAISVDHSHLALLYKNGYIWVGSADLKKKYWEIFTQCPQKPKQLVWCGTDAVVELWETGLETNNLMLFGYEGTDSDVVTYSYDTSIYLVPEIDGVRILSRNVQEFLQKVPIVVQGIFRINSTAPGSYLLEASKQYRKRSHRADQYILLVKPHLEDAVHQCIEAAGYEYEVDNQKMLIRAAQYGKDFVQRICSDEYVKMCRTLRVLNAVRDPRIGIPISISQLQHLSYENLLDRLVLRRYYYLAIMIAKYLRLPETQGSSKILGNWACKKVEQVNLDSERIAQEIANKLGYLPGISYSKIAENALTSGRPDLAIKLMDYEPKTSLQVPLLLQLEQFCPALSKAIESGDTDLVYNVLLHLHKKMSVDQFQLVIRGFPMAQALYIKNCRQQGWETLRSIYNQEDDYLSQAICCVQESYDPKNVASPEASLYSAAENFKKAHNDSLSSLCHDQLRLLGQQKNLESKFGRAFVNLSLHDTVSLLLHLRQAKLADKLRAEHKVPDRRYWWLKVMSLAELGEWLELEKFSKSKKSPIGYEPFVDACLNHDKKSEAEKYLPKVREELKVKYFLKSGMLEEAAQCAYEQKDCDALLLIQSRCASSNTALSEKVNLYLLQLSTKK